MEDGTIEIKVYMQALVKTHRTNIQIQGEIPSRVLDVLRSEYGEKLKIYEGEDEYIEITETDWYKEYVTIIPQENSEFPII